MRSTNTQYFTHAHILNNRVRTMVYVFIVLLVVTIIGYILKNIIKPRKFPPGPKWYPFIGCSDVVHWMTKKYGSQWKGLSTLAKQYSTQVLGLKLGKELIIVVYGEKNIKRVFTGMEFEGRPDNFFVRLRCLGKTMGITFSDGLSWRLLRQFTVKQLRNVGFGKAAMEEEIQKELSKIWNYIERNNYKPINLRKSLAIGVMNVLWKFTAGGQIKEKRLTYLIGLLNARSTAFFMAGGWLNQIPWCRFIFPTLSGFSLIYKTNQQIGDVIEDAIKEHKSIITEGSDFIYSFLEEINVNKNTFTEEQLKSVCLDLLIAGSQTTSNALEFALMSLTRNRLWQDKIYEEIKNKIGDKMPCWTDSYRLPYTTAFLQEVQRYYTIVPLAGPRRVLSNTTIDGYIIPKDTTVLISVGDLHASPNVWSNPREFNPERFIDEHGLLKNFDNMYPFGLGRRRCPGDHLAKSFIFIVLVGILQKYRIEINNSVLPPEEQIIGLISSPKHYNAVFVSRH